MQEFAWEIETRDGREESGRDAWPAMALKRDARTIRLTFPGLKAVFKVTVPVQAKGIFFSTNKAEVDLQTGTVISIERDSFTWGFRYADGSRAVLRYKTQLMPRTPFNDGVRFISWMANKLLGPEKLHILEMQDVDGREGLNDDCD